MNVIMESTDTVVRIPPENAEIIIDQIQNIFILGESKVSEQTSSENKNDQYASKTEQNIIPEAEIPTEDDENENSLDNTRATTFYKDAQLYWKSIPATIDGMLGGFSSINVTDIRGSQDFIKEVFKMKPSPNKNVALDCGAGIIIITCFTTYDYL